jgi:hypothetical protein
MRRFLPRTSLTAATNPTWGYDVCASSAHNRLHARFVASVAGGFSLTAHKNSGAFSAAAFGSGMTAKPALQLREGYATASWSSLDSTAPVLNELVLAISTDAATESKTATALAADFGTTWHAGRDDWQSWWASVFDKSVPTALPFEGQLPALTTNDAALSRTYYMNVVSLLGNARHVRSIILSQVGQPWENQTIFATGGPVCVVVEMTIWGTTLNSVLLTLL